MIAFVLLLFCGSLALETIDELLFMKTSGQFENARANEPGVRIRYCGNAYLGVDATSAATSGVVRVFFFFNNAYIYIIYTRF